MALVIHAVADDKLVLDLKADVVDLHMARLRDRLGDLTGATPVLKSSEHYFFKLSDPRCVEFLETWTQDGRLQPEVANKVNEELRLQYRYLDLRRPEMARNLRTRSKVATASRPRGPRPAF